MKFGLLTLAIVAMVAASLGYVFGGLMAFSKVSDLQIRLDEAEKVLARQSDAVQALSNALALVLAEFDPEVQRSDINVLQIARAALSDI